MIQRLLHLISLTYLSALENFDFDSDYRNNPDERTPHTWVDGWLCIVNDNLRAQSTQGITTHFTAQVFVSTSHQSPVTRMAFIFPSGKTEKEAECLVNANRMNAENNPFSIHYNANEHAYEIKADFEFEIANEVTDTEALEHYNAQSYALFYGLKKSFRFFHEKFKLA
jgi:hypothetical protein